MFNMTHPILKMCLGSSDSSGHGHIMSLAKESRNFNGTVQGHTLKGRLMHGFIYCLRGLPLVLFTCLFGLSAIGQTASAVSSTVTANPATIPTSGTTRLIAQLRTSDGTKITTGGATVTFATPSVGSIGTVTDNSNGTYSATYTAGVSAATVTITAKLSGTDFSNKVYVVVSSQYIIDGTTGNNSVTQSFSTTGNLTLSQGFFVDYLIVGAGGGGANTTSAGGGGGGVQVGTSTVDASSYTITVGTGGTGAYPTGSNGGSSGALSITAGGGLGGGQSSTRNGGNSGSPQSKSGGSGWQASAGVDGASGGGGPGAGAAGSNGGTNSVGGAGGAGLATSITGSSVTYAGGGGGGNEYINLGAATYRYQ